MPARLAGRSPIRLPGRSPMRLFGLLPVGLAGRSLMRQSGLMPVNLAGRLLILALLAGVFSPAAAQTRTDLEQNMQAIENEIRLINQMLQETQRTARVNLNHLVMLNNQINRRQTLLRTIRNEVNAISRRITNLNTNIEELEKEMEELRESYANMIRHAYRSRDGMQQSMFVFSASSFNQAYLRMKYLQQYARHRQLQAEKIEETSVELQERIAELEEERRDQQQLLARQQEELDALSQEQVTQNRTVTQLQRQERELMQQLREQERAARELQRAIERIIAEEQRLAREAAAAEGRPVTDMFALTPEQRILSDNFAENRGKLLWPVERGVITSPFGEQNHPVLRGIKINNNGVDISTTEGAKARAIFNGSVSRVFSIPGGNYAVIIRHGEYLTVYSNLAEVYVRNGQQVTIREELGIIATDQRERKTMINLQVWRGNNKMDPAQWIARQ
jgi:murein hydrolase activator